LDQLSSDVPVSALHGVKMCEVLKHWRDAAGCQKLLEEKTDLQGEATSVWQPQSQLMLPGQQPSEVGKGLLA
jgi:hypothetical protein